MLYPSINLIREKADSRYTLVILAAKRARDIIDGKPKLTEVDIDQEALLRHGLRNLHLPIRDREPPTVPQIRMLIARMNSMLKKDEVLAVHCLAGLGRTGTILASWLIQDGLTASAALERIRKIEPGYVQSVEQEVFLHAVEADLLKRL